MPMRAILLLLLLCLATGPALAQTDGATVSELQSRREGLQRQIEETETLLGTAKKDVRSQLGTLKTLTGQIEEQRRYISALESEVAQLDQEIGAMDRELRRLQADLDRKREQYAASVRYLRHHSAVQDQLLFVFSADNLAQIYRRLRYVRQYATYRRLQGEEIVEKRQEVEQKQSELAQARAEKADLLRSREAEQAKLRDRERDQQRLVAQLKKKQQSLQSTVNKQRREAARLNERIDRLIAEELERQRRAAAKESKGQANTTATATTEADLALSGSFAQNRGRLPMPITGPCLITGHYGQYEVAGLKNVRLDNKGIDIQGKPGAEARAVFDGRVAAVFKLGGLFNILVRHGQYISVYCNLSATTVKTGDEVKTLQSLGTVYTDKADGDRTILHFQLRRETEKLNPELWLRR